MGGNGKTQIAAFTVKNRELNSHGSLLEDDSDEVIIYEVNDELRPIKEIARINLK